MSGHMYDWVTRTWTPVGGRCRINCGYCFMNAMRRFPVIRKKYSGKPRLTGPWPKFKAGETVFVCDCTDINAIPDALCDKILEHCCKWPEAVYVFQSKRPLLFLERLNNNPEQFPPRRIFGTTVETNVEKIGNDGTAFTRIYSMMSLFYRKEETFISIEPIMQFDPKFVDDILYTHPSFVSIGADSKRSRLPEPSADDVRWLIAQLESEGIEVRQKPNLKRILEQK